MDMLNNKKRETVCYFLFIFCMAVGLFYFFSMARPLYIYDTDDWTYISYSRHTWPTVKQFNPAKVLPETLMPITAQIGVSLIMPLTGDYIQSMTYAFAVCLVIFILVYLVQLGKTARHITGIGTYTSILIMGLFLLHHFLPYNHGTGDTKYLLQGGSVNCTYNYLLPGLLNAILVLSLMRRTSDKILKNSDEGGDQAEHIKIGLLLLVYYLALNSNMFHSIILASYAGAYIIISFVSDVIVGNRNKNKIINLTGFIWKNRLWLGIDIAWFIVLILESRGNRAAKATGSLFNLPIGETLKQFTSSVGQMNRGFLLTMFAFVIAGVAAAIINCRKEEASTNNLKIEQARLYLQHIRWIAVSFMITFVYLILLCAKVSPLYMSNNLVEISWVFWLLAAGFLSLAYILSAFPRLVVVVPICLYIVICEVVVDGGTYAENNTAHLPAVTVKALDENLIKQVQEAEGNGFTDVVVKIPLHTSQEWPMNTSYGGGRIAISLYQHGITHKLMNITLKPSQEINDEYGIR